jgi:acetyltransferase-like isoleucine patch superfamily enzyme
MLGIFLNKLFTVFLKIGIPVFGKKKYYQQIDFSLLLINWWHQRIIGRHFHIPYSIHFTNQVSGFDKIIIENNCPKVLTSFAISGGCYFGIATNTTLRIGQGTIWAYNVNIQTSNHQQGDNQLHKGSDIKIGKNCWIAGNVTITAGVTLGNNVIVGANSVVTKSFGDNCVIGGCPARILKQSDLVI